jgi:predicted ATPase
MKRGFTFREAVGTILLGWTSAMQGRENEGIAEIRQGLAAYHATGAAAWRHYWLALLAEAYGQGGRRAEGMTALTEALAAVRTIGDCFYEAEVHRLRGELLLAQKVEHHQWRDAEACFHQALDIANRQEATSLELRAAMSLSRLWQQQGKRHEARELLAPIYGWFTEALTRPIYRRPRHYSKSSRDCGSEPNHLRIGHHW